MKKALKIIIEVVIRLYTKVYNYDKSSKRRRFLNMLYSLWIKPSFSECGTNLMIEKPAFLLGGKYMKIGGNFFSNSRLRIECWDKLEEYAYSPNLSIGNNVSFNYNCHIACINEITIGNNVLFASNIFVTDHFHGDNQDIRDKVPPAQRKLYSKGPVIIEDNVWIGENVVIMPNVTIGANSVIGANAVVTKSFPGNSIIAGVPAKIVNVVGSRENE
jgi:acetyltransferase-like isoleucine patch superfamily enzyme